VLVPFVDPVEVTLDTACGRAAPAAGYPNTCWVEVTPFTVDTDRRFPVAVSYVNCSKYGAGPPKDDADGAAAQSPEDGVHATVN
jgi:hypothetical protein